MGSIYSAKGSYSIGFMLLSDLALAGAVYAIGRMRNIRPADTPTPAAADTPPPATAETR
ncbi:hypothetical protein ABH940_002679 [Streptacidiphilus sp. BW17]